MKTIKTMYIATQKYFILLFAMLYLVSCSSTNRMTLTTVNPPAIHTPKNATKIGIINRTIKQNSNDKLFDDLEKIFSGEILINDKDAVNEILVSFQEQIENKTKFQEIKVIDYINTEERTFTNFPKEITWIELDELCKKNNVDIIVELSYLDTDSKVNYSSQDVIKEVPIIGKKTIKEHIATLETNLLCGWRVYDVSNRYIADEYITNSNFRILGKSINPILALQDILKQREQILRECKLIGEEYAVRFSPYKLRVSRKYFVKGNENFKIANRYAKAGDWDSAAEIWLSETKNEDKEIRGRAFYNMAIINEINGDLVKAKEWAQKSYVECEIDLALDYIDILNNRMSSKKYMEENY